MDTTADLARLGYTNVHVRAGDGYLGWPEAAPFDAVVEATVQRSRPVVLTALAAMLAFIPLTHSVFWGTLAYTLIGGTFGGTVLTLVFLPALYAIWFKIKPVAKDAHAAGEIRADPVPA